MSAHRRKTALAPASARAADSSTAEPWYRDGLRFQCTGCGDCCTGAPGYVWVSDEEIRRLADALGLSAAAFEARYTRSVGDRKSLLEVDHGDCVFFDRSSRQCRVYEHRPLQCRTWPFWQSNLRTPAMWQAVARVCPGCNRGRLYTMGEILVEARRVIV